MNLDQIIKIPLDAIDASNLLGYIELHSAHDVECDACNGIAKWFLSGSFSVNNTHLIWALDTSGYTDEILDAAMEIVGSFVSEPMQVAIAVDGQELFYSLGPPPENDERDEIEETITRAQLIHEAEEELREMCLEMGLKI